MANVLRPLGHWGEYGRIGAVRVQVVPAFYVFLVTKTSLAMNRYLDPTNDISFLKLFGTEAHKPLLISFLNSALQLEGERKIKEVALLPKSQAPLIKDAKSTVLDIKCTDQRNFQYIVEMQNRSVPGFIKRAQFYAAHSYVTQLAAGSSYLELKPVILLAITNHTLFPNEESEDVISYHKTLNTKTQKNSLGDLAYAFVELPKFNKKAHELETVQDQWLYFFKNWEKAQTAPANAKEEVIEAYRSMEEYNWTKEEKDAYIKASIALTDEYDARRKEREEGHETGKKEGIALGEKKGKEEGKKEIAIEMLKKGMEVDLISQLTGMSKQALNQLKAEL